MEKYFKLLGFFTILFILYSCKNNPVIVEIVPPQGESVYRQINITQTDYKVFEISASINFIMDSEKISSVILGNKLSGTFLATDSSNAIYEQSGNNFRLKFQFNSIMDDSVLICQFTIRYNLTDNSFYDLDTFKLTYKYPYQSTEILMKLSKITLPSYNTVQAFDIVDSVLYYHPFGPDGLFKYNFNTEQASLLFDYAAGDHLTAYTNFVYCDVDHNSVYRYNTDSNKVDKKVDVTDFSSNLSIAGMDVYNNKLYVLFDNATISVYDIDLQLERTFSISSPGFLPGYYLTIKDNVAYFYNFNQLTKINLNTLEKLPSVKLPTSDCRAINIIGTKMYFTDYYKQIIGYFNLSEIE